MNFLPVGLRVVLLVWLSVAVAPAAAPDLIVWPDILNPVIVERNYSVTSCDVVEGCALPGPRRYLIFTTETRNIGDADIALGNPAQNRNFVFAPCHGHYHFSDFADYRLVNSAGEQVAVGLKSGFCLEDVSQWDPTVPAVAKYDCQNQGIQRGWADVYSRNLPCQWVDITGVEPGIYLLEIEVNPVGRLLERTRTNNIARMSVVIDGPCSGPPLNDDFADAIAISNRIETVFASTRCATGEAGEPDHPGTRSTNSVWFSWQAPYGGNVIMTTDGSTLDTVMEVYRGTNLATLVSVRGNDDDGDKHTSRVSFTAVSNTIYHVAVAGYTNAQGGVALNINPGANDVFTNYLALVGSSGSISGRNTTARRETGEPSFPGVRGTNSVWFCGQVPLSGLLRFDTEGSNFDTLLAVYTGSRITNLVFVAGDNDSGTNKTSRLYFQAEAGTNYWVAVDGVNGQSGFFRLNWGSPGPGPRFESMTPLTDGSKQLNLAGAIGDRYRIEIAGDSLTWSNWMRLTNLTGRIQFIDPVTNDARRRFYRAVLVP